jgi:hypothetical protein
MELEIDQSGNVVTRPLTAWTMMPVADIAILLAIQYVETPVELETGDKHQIQLVLTPKQGLELAEKLTKLAKRLLQDRPREKPVN